MLDKDEQLRRMEEMSNLGGDAKLQKYEDIIAQRDAQLGILRQVGKTRMGYLSTQLFWITSNIGRSSSRTTSGDVGREQSQQEQEEARPIIKEDEGSWGDG